MAKRINFAVRVSQQLNITARNESGYSSLQLHILARTVLICSVDGGRSEENEMESYSFLLWTSLIAEYAEFFFKYSFVH